MAYVHSPSLIGAGSNRARYLSLSGLQVDKRDSGDVGANGGGVGDIEGTNGGRGNEGETKRAQSQCLCRCFTTALSDLATSHLQYESAGSTPTGNPAVTQH